MTVPTHLEDETMSPKDACRLHIAVDNLAHELAIEADLQNGLDIDGTVIPTRDDLSAALLLPVSPAAIINDLCAALGIEPPSSVTRSLEQA
jgi:hypothetical protein